MARRNRAAACSAAPTRCCRKMGWEQFQRQRMGRRWASIVASPLVRVRAGRAPGANAWAERMYRRGLVGARLRHRGRPPHRGAAGRSRRGLAARPALPQRRMPPLRPRARAGAIRRFVWRAPLTRALKEAEPRSRRLSSPTQVPSASCGAGLQHPLESLWAIRIDPANRITLRMGRNDGGRTRGRVCRDRAAQSFAAMSVRDLSNALRFLTRLPVPATMAGADDLPRTAPWFPLVGAIVGAAVGRGDVGRGARVAVARRPVRPWRGL